MRKCKTHCEGATISIRLDFGRLHLVFALHVWAALMQPDVVLPYRTDIRHILSFSNRRITSLPFRYVRTNLGGGLCVRGGIRGCMQPCCLLP